MTRLLFSILRFKFLGSVALSENEIEFSEYSVFPSLPASHLLRSSSIGSISTVSFDEHCSVDCVSLLLIVNKFEFKPTSLSLISSTQVGPRQIYVVFSTQPRSKLEQKIINVFVRVKTRLNYRPSQPWR